MKILLMTDFIATFQQLSPVIEEMDRAGNGPTQFEILTAMAFCYFHHRAVDLVLLEAGLGGRLDSTNVIRTARFDYYVDFIGAYEYSREYIS